MISGRRILYFLGMAVGVAFLGFSMALARTPMVPRLFVVILIVIGLVIGIGSAMLSVREKIIRDQRGIAGKDPMKIFENLPPRGGSPGKSPRGWSGQQLDEEFRRRQGSEQHKK